MDICLMTVFPSGLLFPVVFPSTLQFADDIHVFAQSELKFMATSLLLSCRCLVLQSECFPETAVSHDGEEVSTATLTSTKHLSLSDLLVDLEKAARSQRVSLPPH